MYVVGTTACNLHSKAGHFWLISRNLPIKYFIFCFFFDILLKAGLGKLKCLFHMWYVFFFRMNLSSVEHFCHHFWVSATANRYDLNFSLPFI